MNQNEIRELNAVEVETVAGGNAMMFDGDWCGTKYPGWWRDRFGPRGPIGPIVIFQPGG